MSVLENYFLESMKLENGGTLLTEEIYRRPETGLIDAEFDKIMKFFANSDNMLKVRKKEIDPNDKFKNELTKIEGLIKKLLNGKIILKFDVASKFDKLSFGMCIFPSNEEMHRRVADALKNPGTGFYLYECNNSMVWIDYAMIGVLLKNKITSGRYLTAVLLHELGHKVYVASQNKIRYYGTNKSIVPTSSKIKNVGTGVAGGILLVVGSMAFELNIESYNTKAAISIISSFIGVVLTTIALAKAQQITDTETYVASESLSDLVAVKYGYGTEIAKTMDIFYAMTKVKVEKMSRLMRWFRKSANELNASKLRRTEVKKALEKELKDSANSEVEKKKIREMLKNIEEMESLNEEFNCNAFITFGEACESLNEALTFRSADMGKIRHMLHSKKVIEKIAKLGKKGWKIAHKATDLNPLNLKVVENKIREIAEHSVTKTVGASVGDTVEVGGGVSETSLRLRNVVLMEVQEFLCIVEGTDKGRVLSCTAILINDVEQLKFLKIQHSAFKF